MCRRELFRDIITEENNYSIRESELYPINEVD